MNDTHTDNQKLDDLLEMVQFIKDHGASQASVDERFEAVDRRFESIDRRFESIDQRFEGIDQRFEGLQNEMQKGFADLRDDFRSELRDVRRELEEIKTKLDALEKTAMEDTTAIGGHAIKLHTHIQLLEKRVQRLENVQKEHA